MNLTVILCTFNRCFSLPKALDSLVGQILPSGMTWEVIVVDNNSTDQTCAVVEDYRRRYPGRFRYLFEPRQGLSLARNAGIREANGDVLAFIDDDVIAEPTWLQDLTVSLHDGKWVGAGGRILPPSDFNPPAWLPLGGEMDLGGALALFDLGGLPERLNRPPYGTNMAFRKRMFEKHGGFRGDLGRCGKGLLSGEDTEFGSRLMLAGECLRYEPAAVVYHPVPKERLSKRYFCNWWFNFGRSRIIERDARPAVLRIPREFISIVNLAWRFLPARIMRWVLSMEPQSRFYNKCQVWLTIGEMVENYRRAVAPKNETRQIQSISH